MPDDLLISNDGEGEHFWFDGTLITLKATGAQTAGRCLIFECVTPSKPNDLHAHPDADEVFLILDGEVVVRTEHGREARSAGSVAFVPRGVAHAVEAISESARILALLTPASEPTEAYIREIGEPASSRSLPAPPTDYEIARMRAAAARYGLTNARVAM
jgi:quercetin dioxygenase-like cupin family protein